MVLAREFVDFFEKHVPIIATALVSIIGAAVMLIVIEPWVGLACLGALVLCITRCCHALPDATRSCMNG